jgi:hypothetical protein
MPNTYQLGMEEVNIKEETVKENERERLIAFPISNGLWCQQSQSEPRFILSFPYQSCCIYFPATFWDPPFIARKPPLTAFPLLSSPNAKSSIEIPRSSADILIMPKNYNTRRVAT